MSEALDAPVARLQGSGLCWIADPAWAAEAATGFGWVSSAAVDAEDRVVVLQRRAPALVVLAPDGAVHATRDVGGIVDAHGISIAGGAAYLVDRDGHAVHRVAGDGGCERLFAGAGVAFCHPTDIAVDPVTKEVFVSDGYGGASVHRFDADGRHLLSFGGHGATTGRFNLVHALALDPRGRVIVADCGNGRVQVFSPDGECVAVWEGFFRPLGVHVDRERELVFVTEGSTRMTARTLDGEVVAGGRTPGNAHDVCGDARGNLYLSIPGARAVLKLALGPR